MALLGFCGAPWTVATYMIAGVGTADQSPARLFAYRDPQTFASLIDVLVNSSVEHLARQFDAGVDAVQIFGVWGKIPWPRLNMKGPWDSLSRMVPTARSRAVPPATYEAPKRTVANATSPLREAILANSPS